MIIHSGLVVPEPDSLGTAGQSGGGAAQETAAARDRGARVLRNHHIVFIINEYLRPLFSVLVIRIHASTC
jgi:hypothetical protein